LIVITGVYIVARRVFAKRKRQSIAWPLLVLEAMLLFGVGLVAVLVLQPVARSPWAGSNIDLIPFDDFSGPIQGLEAIAQGAVFLPVGLVAGLRSPRVGVYALGLPVVIELIQAAVPSLGRVASTQDALIGMAGAVVGWAISAAIRRLLTRHGLSGGSTPRTAPNSPGRLGVK